MVSWRNRGNTYFKDIIQCRYRYQLHVIIYNIIIIICTETSLVSVVSCVHFHTFALLQRVEH